MTDRIAYRTAEVAELLGVDVVRVQRWINSGELPAAKIGGLWFVAAADLDARLRGYDADELREAVAKFVAWQYRERGAARFTLTDLRAALRESDR